MENSKFTLYEKKKSILHDFETKQQSNLFVNVIKCDACYFSIIELNSNFYES
jgi:hypothetical protein